MYFSKATIIAVAALVSTGYAQYNSNTAYRDYVQPCIEQNRQGVDGNTCCGKSYDTCVSKTGGDIANCQDIEGTCKQATGAKEKRQFDSNTAYRDYVQPCIEQNHQGVDGTTCCNKSYDTCVSKTGGDIANCQDIEGTCKQATGAKEKRQFNSNTAYRDYVQPCIEKNRDEGLDGETCCNDSYDTCVSKTNGDIANCQDIEGTCKQATGAKSA
ncbi:hypothetical protein UCDDS831_g09121 [Diplodia seriata]|uniref:Uncharacterized protein n=1 Tax=Diplodia seriata TaxID=420778 RepID=A0A0G2DRJ9_9PEZI|nr:hypothetical protein UCDDS831_g09121 [Diplodia seriata]